MYTESQIPVDMPWLNKTCLDLSASIYQIMLHQRNRFHFWASYCLFSDKWSVLITHDLKIESINQNEFYNIETIARNHLRRISSVI